MKLLTTISKTQSTYCWDCNEIDRFNLCCEEKSEYYAVVVVVVIVVVVVVVVVVVDVD